MASEVLRATGGFISTHQGDLAYVGGHGNRLSLTEIPESDNYNLMLPSAYDIDALMSASLLVYACMDKRQSADVYQYLSMNGQDRVMVTSAGGAEQRKSRFKSDVAFWSQLLIESPAHPVLSLLIHLKRCGGAVAQETEAVVTQWIASGTEQEMMTSRAYEMRDAVWLASGRKATINVGCVFINSADQFAGIQLVTR